MLQLTKGQINKANKKHGRKFAPKYKAFKILQNQIEDVVQKSTLMWKVIYGLKIVKEGEEDHFEGKDDKEEEEKEEKEEKEEEEREKEKEEVGEKEKQEETVDKAQLG